MHTLACSPECAPFIPRFIVPGLPRDSGALNSICISVAYYSISLLALLEVPFQRAQLSLMT